MAIEKAYNYVRNAWGSTVHAMAKYAKIGVCIGTLAAVGFFLHQYYKSPTPKPGVDYAALIRNAKKIEINEQELYLNKHYDILVEGEIVGTVTGKVIELHGDVFTLETIDGKVLASEKEKKRLLSWTRGAEFFDSNGSTTGYLGEETISKLFNMSYVMHFYNKEGDEIGRSEKFTSSSLGSHKVEGPDGNIDYDIDKHFWPPSFLWGDVFTVTVEDSDSPIPIEHAILLTCIEDVIADSQED